MKKNALFLPIKIRIFLSKPCFGQEVSTSFYTKDGKPYYYMGTTEHSSNTMEFTSQIYCDLISVQSTQEARKFVDDYPYLRFAFSGQPYMDINEYETEESYYKLMADSVALYNELKLFGFMQVGADESIPEEQLSTLLEMYQKHYRLLRGKKTSWPTFYDMKNTLFENNDVVDEVTEAAQERARVLGTSLEEAYKELREEYFDGKENLLREHYKIVEQQVDQIIRAEMVEDYERFFETILKGASATYSISDGSLIYSCKDLITAMYMMTYIAAFNEENYQECADEKCHRWYLVDKRHPQSRCPEHMLARQKKRKNYKKNHPFP